MLLTPREYSCMLIGMTPRKMHTQNLYLEPEKAEALEALAAKTRIPKAVLLREAVDYLLAVHGADLASSKIDFVRDSLRKGERLLHNVCYGRREPPTMKQMFDAATESLTYIFQALNQLDERPRDHQRAPGKHWMTKLEESEGKKPR